MNRVSLPLAKGWCPGAHRPMAAGDGLLVRVRPPLARLTVGQAMGLCALARDLGAGFIDLTNRANLQLRGVLPRDHAAVIEALCGLGVLDADATREARPPILVAPDWRAGDDTESIATALAARLGELPRLPAKFGFAVDAGPAPVLVASSADVRIERARSGGLIVRADGAADGQLVSRDDAVDAALALAAWFAISAGAGGQRMRGHLSTHDLPTGTALRDVAAASAALPAPGMSPLGPVYGVAFGQIDAAALARLLRDSGARALRLTPNRSVILEGGQWLESSTALTAFITAADDPLLHVDACPGAPACASATVETRAVARELARAVALGAPAAGPSPSVHVSGCSKGCARARAADITLVGRNGAFDLVRGGCAGDAPSRTGLSPDVARSSLGAAVYAYETDGAAIYRRSFAIIRAEADLARFDADDEPIAVRMIHAAGLIGLEAHLRFSTGFVRAARVALEAGAPILCDARMVGEGVTRSRLPCGNEVICTLHDAAVPALAAALSTTRSAAALELWRPRLQGAVVAIGNAPTALFHLLAMLQDPACPRPAAIVGCPVGFVGAAESKEALWAEQPVPCCTVAGRLGGSAIAVAALNALGSRAE